MAALLVTAAGACDGPEEQPERPSESAAEDTRPSDSDPERPGPRTGTGESEPPPSAGSRRPVTLGFAGDVHFEGDLAALLRRPRTALRPVAATLRRPDLMMLNLETALTRRGSPEPKRFTFRSSPRALRVLDRAGVDVVSLANNHAVDYGRVGLRDTLRAVRRSPVPVVGIGRDATAAFRPLEVSLRGTKVSVLAATTKSERTARVWGAGDDKPGVAVAIEPTPTLLRAVRDADDRSDVVVVYLHWGKEYESCPNQRVRRYARELGRAGADVVLGSHSHVLRGAGWAADGTYVGYGLGNFVWYNQNSTSTGILTLTIRGQRVVADSFTPARIGADGRPRLLPTARSRAAVDDWRRLRRCTDLAATPPG